jgi:hypothetical protein
MSEVVPTETAVPWRPTADEVARLLRARTKDATGTEVGAWTSDTRPSLSEVEDLIDQAVELMQARTGTDLAEPCASGAHRLAGLLAAMLVELSYFPEQVNSDRSAYPEYKRLYDDGMNALAECIAQSGEGGRTGYGLNYYSVPVIPETTARLLGGVGGWDALLGPWGDVGADHWPEAENPANWRETLQPPREPPLPEDLPVGGLPASGEELR